MPPRCLLCHELVTCSRMVCADCFKKFEFIIDPYCKSCGNPFLSEEEAGVYSICADCSISTPLWQECRAAFIYNDAIKKLILPFKYADQVHALRFFTYYMYQNTKVLLQHVDYIVPIPLHKKRLRHRKYNQSALLARQLQDISGSKVMFAPLMLHRIKDTEYLGHFSKVERKFILKDAFSIDQKYCKPIKNKNILLIDDVMTTGSTMSECSRILLDAGAARIDVSVVAKVCFHHTS